VTLGTEELRECTKNLIFKEETHKKKRDYPVYSSEIQNLLGGCIEWPRDRWKGYRRLRLGARSASLISPISQCRWSTVDSMVLLDCTDFTGEKELRESDEAFFKSSDTTVASQNSEKNHSESRGAMVFILIILNYSGDGIGFVN